MKRIPDGNAIVYCEGAFNTTNGKTAHGLVRFSNRYNVIAVIDSRFSGKDAGAVLDGKKSNIPICTDLDKALANCRLSRGKATHFVIGLAPDGGGTNNVIHSAIRQAISAGLHVDSGLHDFMTDDPSLTEFAESHHVLLRDMRKPPEKKHLHFFSGKITDVKALKIAILGTDSAVGKRTTAWIMVHALQEIGYKAELVGTGQTAWMQGARYGIILDSLINDFVAGEIEHAVWSAWTECRPDIIIIEGQGSIMNPAYPGGFEILAAGRPDIIIVQHAPARMEYDGFPGYPLHSVCDQIKAIEMLSSKPVIAVTINHEGIAKTNISVVCKTMTQTLGLPVYDVLSYGADALVQHIVTSYLNKEHLQWH